MPLYSRTRYLEEVAAGLRKCQVRDGWRLYAVPDVTSPSLYASLDWGMELKTVDGVVGDVNERIVHGFDAASSDGARTIVYQADDCVPAPDMLRLADWLAARHCLFGLWTPAVREAKRYPELVLPVRGHVWPAKGWGCTVELWPLIRSVLVGAGGMTYDSALAETCTAQNWFILVPLCPRVKDVGEYGAYNTVEEWREYFSYVACVDDYGGEYMMLWNA